MERKKQPTRILKKESITDQTQQQQQKTRNNLNKQNAHSILHSTFTLAVALYIQLHLMALYARS